MIRRRKKGKVEVTRGFKRQEKWEKMVGKDLVGKIERRKRRYKRRRGRKSSGNRNKKDKKKQGMGKEMEEEKAVNRGEVEKEIKDQ